MNRRSLIVAIGAAATLAPASLNWSAPRALSSPALLTSSRRDLHNYLGDQAVPVTAFDGVVGDNVFDCTDGIQSAVDSGYDIWFPPTGGLFRISETVIISKPRIKLFGSVRQRSPNVRDFEYDRNKTSGMITNANNIGSLLRFSNEGGSVDNVILIGSGPSSGQVGVLVKKNYDNRFTGNAAADFSTSNLTAVNLSAGVEAWGWGISITGLHTGRVRTAICAEFPSENQHRPRNETQTQSAAFRQWTIQNCVFHATTIGFTNIGENAEIINGLMISDIISDTGMCIFKGCLRNSLISDIVVSNMDNFSRDKEYCIIELNSGSEFYIVNNIVVTATSVQDKDLVSRGIVVDGIHSGGTISSVTLSGLAGIPILMLGAGKKDINFDNITINRIRPHGDRGQQALIQISDGIAVLGVVNMRASDIDMVDGSAVFSTSEGAELQIESGKIYIESNKKMPVYDGNVSLDKAVNYRHRE